MISSPLTHFRNLHQGQRCVLVCNGPSLNRMDLGFLRNEIVFGLNKIYLGLEKFGFYPRYVVAVNDKVIAQSASAYRQMTAIKFISDLGAELLPQDAFTYHIRTEDLPERFYCDITEGVRGGHTVTHAALQIAYYMGFDEVIIMEPAVTPLPGQPSDAGVTLIELVVVAVVARLVLGVTLTRGLGGARGERDLIAFRTTYDQARSLAVHGQVQRGLALSAQGRRIAWWRGDGWQLSEQLMPWRGRVAYQIEGPSAAPDTPDILFLPNGQTSAFSIQFDRISCRSDGWTGLICDAG